MCGRATLTCPVDEIAEHFDVAPIPLGPPRFNVAPSQPMLVVRAPGGAGGGGRELALVRWGLVPSFARDPKEGSRFVQARAETASTSGAYREAFRSRRCLVVVDGFYEWGPSGAGGRSPYLVRPRVGGPFAIAGIWERWLARDGEVVESCAVLTTGARGALAAVHDRMPFVLGPDAYDAWLHGSFDEARGLVARAPDHVGARAEELDVVAVSTWVNDVRHDDPRCVAPADAEPPRQIAFTFD